MKNNKGSIMLMIVVVIVAVLAVSGAYNLGKSSRTGLNGDNYKQDDSDYRTVTPTSNSVTNSTSKKEVASEAWVTYRFDGPVDFTIKHPSSWVPKATSINPYAANMVLVRKGDNATISIAQADGGGGLCIFSDSKQSPDGNFDTDLRHLPFVEISTPIGILRRFPAESIYPKLGIDYSFCAKNSNGTFSGGAYSTPVGGMSYSLPSNYDANLLAEMDAIVKTINK